ncbi:unnamed protein product [Brassica rapa]|uniref:Uncharacterized protein n=1 Tax=Brassica campestris TaxID=3711 RepID=A0A3P5Z2I5_BRACM|nr:unnamed protein product [Brassica rapa]VDC74256.1 unnamed protein product [Brassica rapa]
MAMTWMRRFYSKIKGKKVKELPAYIKSTYSMESVKTYVMKAPSILSFISALEAWLSLTSLLSPTRNAFSRRSMLRRRRSSLKRSLPRSSLLRSSMLRRNLFRSLEMIFRYSKVRSF